MNLLIETCHQNKINQTFLQTIFRTFKSIKISFQYKSNQITTTMSQEKPKSQSEPIEPEVISQEIGSKSKHDIDEEEEKKFEAANIVDVPSSKSHSSSPLVPHPGGESPYAKKILELPKRQKGLHTNKFKSISLVTNHYFVELEMLLQKIIIFSVKITPSIPFDNRTLRVKLLNDSLPEIEKFIKRPVISGMNIFTTFDPIETQKSIACGHFTLDFKKVKEFNLKENMRLLLLFLNNGLRNLMNKLNYVEIGRTGKYFNPKEKKQIENLIMFSGFKANFCFLEKGFYLKVDSAKKIVRNQTVMQTIDQIYKQHQDKEKEERRNLVKNALVGQIVMTNYGKTRYQKIQDIVFEDLEKIHLDGENSTSLKNYYQEKYNITIKNLKQPLLHVENKRAKKGEELDPSKRTLLLPELCLMTGIPQNFDEFKRKKISEQTILDPYQKQREIGKLMNELKETRQILALKELGIKLNKNMAEITAKAIPMPKLKLGQKNTVEDGKEAFFNLFNKPIFASKHSIKCGLIYARSADVRMMKETIENTSRNFKVNLQLIDFVINDEDMRKGVDCIKRLLSDAVNQKNDCNICLIVIPNSLKLKYKDIKQYAIFKKELITQCMTEFTLRKKNLQSIATKILLQILAKRGNTLWVPSPRTNVELESSMLAAFDHSKVNASKFVQTCCATLNSTFSSVFSSNLNYSGNEECFQTMQSLILKAVDAYVKRNKNPPKEIFIFMNSCTGDQIQMYHEHFIEPVIKEMRDIYISSPPSITLLMVNVKTNQRFFSKMGDQFRNPQAGTLVSEAVVSQNYDFYLVSQNSNKGSVVPNHYKVIYSDSKIEEGVLQELIFDQCFNYVNWTGSIKVPGILQYAKKCTKFNSEFLDCQEVPEDLNNKLYFV